MEKGQHQRHLWQKSKQKCIKIQQEKQIKLFCKKKNILKIKLSKNYHSMIRMSGTILINFDTFFSNFLFPSAPNLVKNCPKFTNIPNELKCSSLASFPAFSVSGVPLMGRLWPYL